MIKDNLQQFHKVNLNKKDPQKHTFQFLENSYYCLPIFKTNKNIQFNKNTYKIIKLLRRTEIGLIYKIYHEKSNQKLQIEYQYKTDYQDNEYYYHKDDTEFKPGKQSNNQYRQYCRIAEKKHKEIKNHFFQLTRYIHLNTSQKNRKIQLFCKLSVHEQLQELDYNQIFVNDQSEFKIIQNQSQNSCFVQAPLAISPIIKYQQTFLIGFYYAIINNITIFNQYINKQNQIQSSIRRPNPDLQLQQQIAGALNYNYKLQIPKQIMLKEIQQFQQNNQDGGEERNIYQKGLIQILSDIYEKYQFFWEILNQTFKDENKKGKEKKIQELLITCIKKQIKQEIKEDNSSHLLYQLFIIKLAYKTELCNNHNEQTMKNKFEFLNFQKQPSICFGDFLNSIAPYNFMINIWDAICENLKNLDYLEEPLLFVDNIIWQFDKATKQKNKNYNDNNDNNDNNNSNNQNIILIIKILIIVLKQQQELLDSNKNKYIYNKLEQNTEVILIIHILISEMNKMNIASIEVQFPVVISYSD